MSSLLSNLYPFGRYRGGNGGVRLGEVRVYTLSYVDDMVLLAEGEDEMRSMMERLEVYLGKKNLALNTKKTEVMRFKRGAGKVGRDWRWGGKKIEKVREYKYLGYAKKRKARSAR